MNFVIVSAMHWSWTLKSRSAPRGVSVARIASSSSG